jgi:hypothetical protein
MPTWSELDLQFRELEPALRHHRIDYQWGGGGDILELRGVHSRQVHRFEILADIAGRKLSPQDQLEPAVMARPAGRERWFEALRWHSGVFEYGPVVQSVLNGAPQPYTYTGSVQNPADASATLALHFSDLEPPPIAPASKWPRWLSTLPARIVASIAFLSTLVGSIVGLVQLERWHHNTPEPGHVEIHSVSAPTPSISNSVGNVYGNSGIVAPGATGPITQVGQLPPPPRVMTPEQMAVAVDELRKAHSGSIIRLNYSADNGVDEVEKFYAQVHAVFKQSKHWRVFPSRIGKSMGFAGGGTLTGEGVRCTSSSKAGKIAIEAMRLAGFPCIGEARDWNVTAEGRLRSDVVISIGSRFIPSE